MLFDHGTRQLCEELILADTEDRVVELLHRAGYWEEDEVWRLLGDSENNFSIVGNQQSDAIGALAEKIVNSIDARLINEARMHGVEPEGKDAPSSIREAVSRFVEGNETYDLDRHGLIRFWDPKLLSTEADRITLTATGSRPRRGRRLQASLTIADQGEGQTPDDFPDTFMSLQRSNKLRIQFVQGKFNMGGTGALQFCSPVHNLQLIVSKRNPKLLNSNQRNPRDSEWGFTVVRRRDPDHGLRSSYYEYLAPVIGQDGNRAVLSYAADSMPLFPTDFENPYNRESEFGSLVKLYEFDWTGDRSDITRGRGGLLRRLELKVADPALPFRVYECRGYRKDTAYHDGAGVVNFVEANRNDVELDIGADLSVKGKKIPAHAYLFKTGEAEDVRMADHGVLVTVNGQTHAFMHSRFFRRRSVRLGYLDRDLLVLTDCSEIDGRTREDMFMNSRDRMRSGDAAAELEASIETWLRENPRLRAANRKKRDESLREAAQSDEHINNILRDFFGTDTQLARYLLTGSNIGWRVDVIEPQKEYEGRRFPTYVVFDRTKSNEYLRETEIGSRVSVSFETDAENEYFDRIRSPGRWRVTDGLGTDCTVEWSRTGPDEGRFTLTRRTGHDGNAGDQIQYLIEFEDDDRIFPLSNQLTLELVEPRESKPSDNPEPRPPSRFAPPRWQRVDKEAWTDHGFNEDSALRIVLADGIGENEQEYDFFVNVDNQHLLRHVQQAETDLEAHRLIYGNALVLIGLALLRRWEKRKDNQSDEEEVDALAIEDYVAYASEGISVVLLPMLKQLATETTDESATE